MLVESSLAVQRLGLSTFIAKGLGSIPGWVTKILPAAQCGWDMAGGAGGRGEAC